MRTTLLALLLLLAGAARAQAPETIMLRLRDGSVRWGSLQGHDPDGIRFQVLETGGVARLPWSLLDPAEERELRARFGYVELGAEEVTIEADRLVLVDGGEVVGLIVDRTADALIVKQNGATVPVPKNRLAGASSTVTVPATAVFTREELYARELDAASPRTAEDHFRLGQYCERILDYAHAVEHYAKAAEADPSFRRDDVAVARQRCEARAARQAEVDWLADVDLLAARRKYDEALARAAAFAEKFPSSELLPDAKKREQRVVRARDRDVAERVARSWHAWLGRLARDAASKMSFDETLGYLEDRLSQDVLDRVTKEVSAITKTADPEVVRRMWKDRRKVHWYRASYGLGTWLLGKKAALAGEEDAPKEAAPVGEKDRQRAELEEKIRRWLANQELARATKSKEEQVDERELVWKEIGSAARAQWMIAWYAENSGDLEVGAKPMLANCRECGGKGTREIAVAGGNVATSMVGSGRANQTIECPTCRGLGRVRRISYR